MYSKRNHGYYLQSKGYTPTPKWILIRSIGQDKLTDKAQLKLEWIIFYHTVAKGSVRDTTSHFGITRKTFYKWLTRFDERNILSLEESSRAPHRTRKRMISVLEEHRIITLRRKHIRWGKMKLQNRYKKIYHTYISSWRIQRVIEDKQLYFDKKAIQKSHSKRKQIQKQGRKRITQFAKVQVPNHLWHVDTVIFTLPQGGYRYLLTAIDDVSKIAYARFYKTHSSKHTTDFLKRIMYLTSGEILHIHHDNGTEFEKEFKRACEQLGLPQYYSRPHTPKDNSVLERFNRTIQEEFVDTIDIGLEDIQEVNTLLTPWLIEYEPGG
jgi:transposase InsO family protein